ncbi:MAG: hypothetical protein JO016_05595 [Actinobacteria bacterium]|nr:hypothetical protein [Actinomycetota bacterium]
MLAAGLLTAPSASAATTTASTATAATTGSGTTPLRVQARVSNSRPRDRSTEYIEVTTAKGAKVTAVAHFRTGPQTRTATANSRGDATLAYAVGHATPGDRVVVTVTATSGQDHAVTLTYFTPQR